MLKPSPGLDPDQSKARSGAGGQVAYWRVDDVEAAVRRFRAVGASVVSAPQDVGEGIKAVTDPFGNVIGLLENPHFRLTPG